MIEIIEENPKDHAELFKNEILHVVCMADGGLTMCDFFASTIGGMNQQDEVWPLTKEINKKGEVGTFWPKMPLTIIPKTSWEGRKENNLEGFFIKCFQDVAESNREYVQLKSMYLTINEYDTEERMIALIQAKKILSNSAAIEKLWISPKPKSVSI